MDLFFERIFKNNLKTIAWLLVPAFILFIKSLGYEFTSMDEQWMVVKNVPFLKQWSSLKNAFVKPITDIYYRPFLMVSFIIDYHLGQLSPFIYHLTNLILHLACVYLLFRFLLSCKVEKKIAFIFSLLFSLHPIVLHAVVWVPGRNDLLLCIFTLLSLIYLNKFIFTQSFKFFFFHLLFFCFALLTKENAIVLPSVFLMQYFVFREKKSNSIYLYGFIWILIAGLFFVVRDKILSTPSIDSFSVHGLKNFVLAFVMCTGKVILPFYQSILPIVKIPSVIVSLLGIGLVVFLVVKQGLINKKVALLGLFVFFIFLVIPIWFGAFKSGGEHYEHRSYTSLVGLMLFLSQIKFNTHSKAFHNYLVAILCLFFIKSFARMPVYKNKQSFVDAGLKERPDYYLFYLQKGEALYAKREYRQSYDLFSKAIEIRPDKGDLYSNRGSAAYALGMYQEAVSDYTEAINKSTEFKMEYYLNRCIVYNKVGDSENATMDFLVLKKCCAERIPPNLDKTMMEKLNASKAEHK